MRTFCFVTNASCWSTVISQLPFTRIVSRHVEPAHLPALIGWGSHDGSKPGFWSSGGGGGPSVSDCAWASPVATAKRIPTIHRRFMLIACSPVPLQVPGGTEAQLRPMDYKMSFVFALRPAGRGGRVRAN